MDIKPQNRKEYLYSLSHDSYIRHLSQSLRDQLPITHVWASRYYFNGMYLDIGTDPDWKMKMSESSWYDDFTQSFLNNFAYSKKNHPFFLSWSVEGNDANNLLNQINYNCNVLSGFNLISIHDDYVENYGFASPLSLNKLSIKISPFDTEIRNLIFLIRTSMHPILNTSIQNLGILNNPFKCFKIDTTLNLSAPNKIPVCINDTLVFLTLREFKCLNLISQGQRYKNIANIMNISPRTVEFYLNRIHIKTNLRIREELIPLLKSQNMFELFSV